MLSFMLVGIATCLHTAAVTIPTSDSFRKFVSPIIPSGPEGLRLRRFATNHWERIHGLGSPSAESWAYLYPGQECDAPFPGLRARPWHPPHEFSWALDVETGASVAIEELQCVGNLLENHWQDRYTSLCSNTSYFSKLIHQDDFGNATEIGQQCFPKTLALVRNLPLAPRPVCINRQGPCSGLAPHTDNINFLLICHLGLQVPGNKCRFTMTGPPKTHSSWENEKLLVADTSFVHTTTNDSDEDRNVLHFAIWHPDLTVSERNGIVKLQQAFSAYETSQRSETS